MSLPQAQAEDVSVFGKGVAPCLAGTGKNAILFITEKDMPAWPGA